MSVYVLGSPSWNGIMAMPYNILAWTKQSVNCILPENTCFICYIIPNLWIKNNSYCLTTFYKLKKVKYQSSKVKTI